VILLMILMTLMKMMMVLMIKTPRAADQVRGQETEDQAQTLGHREAEGVPALAPVRVSPVAAPVSVAVPQAPASAKVAAASAPDDLAVPPGTKERQRFVCLVLCRVFNAPFL
jgi:hypothetical protein